MNVPRCSKARAGEQVDFYPGFGEVCPECGRALTKLAPEGTEAAPAAYSVPQTDVANAGGRATIVPPPVAPPDPIARPRRLITGHSPSEAPLRPDTEPARPMAPIAPIVPIRPGPEDVAEVPSAIVAAEPPVDEEAIPPVPEAQPQPQPPAPPAAQPPAPPRQAPPQARPAETLVQAVVQPPEASAAPPPPAPPIDSNRWYIPTPERVDDDDFSENKYEGRQSSRRIPRAYILAGLGVALAAALGTFIYNLAAPVLGARPVATAAFHMCGSRALAGKLGVNLSKAFFSKLGATGVNVTPYGSTGLVVTAKVPGRWQPQSIAIDTSEDSSVIGSLSAKMCQVGLMATPVDNRGALANAGILGKIIGYDAAVIVANPLNPVTRLSTSQLAGIFSGSITNWSQAGGPSAAITVFAPDEPSYYLSSLRRSLLGGSSLLAGAHVLAGQSEVSAAVSKNRYAIGFVGFVFADPGHVLKVTGSNGNDFLPTAATIGQRQYPLTLPVYLYNVAQQTDPMVFDFVDFARSDAGQTVVEDAGYVSRLSL